MSSNNDVYLPTDLAQVDPKSLTGEMLPDGSVGLHVILKSGAVPASPTGGLTNGELRQLPVDTYLLNPTLPAGASTVAAQNAQTALLAEIDGTLDRGGPQFNKILDQVNANLLYICEAVPGSSPAAAVWRVKRVSTSGTVTSISYAGAGYFDQIANNRASLSY